MARKPKLEVKPIALMAPVFGVAITSILAGDPTIAANWPALAAGAGYVGAIAEGLLSSIELPRNMTLRSRLEKIYRKAIDDALADPRGEFGLSDDSIEVLKKGLLSCEDYQNELNNNPGSNDELESLTEIVREILQSDTEGYDESIEDYIGPLTERICENVKAAIEDDADLLVLVNKQTSDAILRKINDIAAHTSRLPEMDAKLDKIIDLPPSSPSTSPKTEAQKAEVITRTQPPRPTQHFVGRKDTRRKAKKKLFEDSEIVLFYGMGGSGKSEVTRKFLKRYWEKKVKNGIEYIGWCPYDGSLQQTLASEFPQYAAETNPELFLSVVTTYLNRLGDKLLLVIDDVKNLEPDDANHLLNLQCRVILTARQKIDRLEGIEIDRLSADDSLALYRKHLGDKSYPTEKLDPILERAGGHALTLELLAKAQCAEGCSDEEFLEILNTCGLNLSAEVNYNENNAAFIEHMAKVFSIFGIEGEELRILRLFSLISSEQISTKQVKTWFALSNMGDVNKLVQKGLIRKAGRSHYAMHPAVSEAIRHQTAKDGKVGIDEAGSLIEALIEEISYSQKETFIKALPSLPHTIRVADYFTEEDDARIAILYNWSASAFDSQGDYPRALEYHTRALEICERTLGEEHPDTAASYNNIGVVYAKQGDYPRALELLTRALEICERTLGEEHPDTATSYNNVGLVYSQQGDYQRALEYHTRAIEIRERTLGEEHPDTATSYNNVGLVYAKQGDYPRALELLTRALTIRERTLGEEHPDTAASYNNIGVVYAKQGDYPRALELLTRALEIFERTLGEEHPETIATREDIAAVKKKLKD